MKLLTHFAPINGSGDGWEARAFLIECDQGTVNLSAQFLDPRGRNDALVVFLSRQLQFKKLDKGEKELPPETITYISTLTKTPRLLEKFVVFQMNSVSKVVYSYIVIQILGSGCWPRELFYLL